ncbi:MAG: hypothetical protein ABJA67_03020, partial [Chthonomonadales bacterium]
VTWSASLMTALVTFGPGGLMAESKASYLSDKDITDIPGLVADVKKSKVPTIVYFATHSPVFQKLTEMDEIPAMQLPAASMTITQELNSLINCGVNMTKSGDFAVANLSAELKKKAESAGTPAEIAHVNRLLLSDLFPERIAAVRSPMQLLVRDFMILPVGAFAYGALFLLLATLLNRPLMWGLVFAFGWESWVPTMPGNFQRVSLMSYLRALAPHPQQTTDRAGMTELLSAFSSSTISAQLAWTVLFSVTVICLTMALVLFSNNEFVPREDAE